MTDVVTALLGLGQLGALVEIARRLGTLRADLTHVRSRVKALEKETA